MKMYPLKFRPIFKERIWGGGKLREVFGKDLPANTKIGESWELADLPNDKSVISNGLLAGQTLRSVLRKYPKEITGDENFSPPFPLLIKLLDARQVLSVQVHPDSETCLRTGAGDPKTECWYILSADPGAVIYKGLKQGVTRQRFAEAIKAGNVEELLEKVEVEAGQCHFLPAGTAHAIGAGLLIAEIQLPSDTTYRVFDWNRVDATGRGRPLHINQALESIHFDPSGDNLSVTTTGRLVDCRYFKIDKKCQKKGDRVTFSSGKMATLIILSGQGIISDDDQSQTSFKPADTLLIPASFDGQMLFEADTEYLSVNPMWNLGLNNG